MFDVLVVGGGAAGFYGAIHIAETDGTLKVGILERGSKVLSKVKVSGGGRCNVTHAEFDPRALAQHYPRGERELLGPFHNHNSAETMTFFETRGVSLKAEDDGRIFPQSDSSQTVIDCFLKEVGRLGILLIKNSPLLELNFNNDEGYWEIRSKKTTFKAKYILLATGSNPKIWHLLERLGHTIIPPVASLFTFNITDESLNGLQGISVHARIGILEKKAANQRVTVSLRSQQPETVTLESEGPLLITHWGLSGPAVLKLSAWGARILHNYGYSFRIRINWVPDYHVGAVLSVLTEIKELEAKKTAIRTNAFDIPKRLWAKLVLAAGIDRHEKWADLSKVQLQQLHRQLTATQFQVEGKSTFKEEFVTAGGVSLKEIDFRTFQSKLLPKLYFAGEIIDVDAITGGFNFQNAWTGAFLAARAITASG